MKMKTINQQTLFQLRITFAFMLLCGAVLNVSAVAYNDGRMPVYNPENKYGNLNTTYHFSFQNFEDIKKPFLVDVIRIGFYQYSVGDLIMFVSIEAYFFIWIYEVILFYKNNFLYIIR